MTHDWRNPERVAPWKPRQAFRVTAQGLAAIDQYRDSIRQAQASADARTALVGAKQSWADALGLRPIDGILLDDMALGHTCLADMQKTLESCDLTTRDARGGLDRLVRAGLIETLDGSAVPRSAWERSRP